MWISSFRAHLWREVVVRGEEYKVKGLRSLGGDPDVSWTYLKQGVGSSAIGLVGPIAVPVGRATLGRIY
jgi:hypothetical protein